MNILHITTGFSIDFNGGITNYVRSIAKSQANNNNVFVLCDDGEDDIYKVIKLNSYTNTWGYSDKRSRNQLLQLDFILKEKKIDLVHIHMMLNFDQRIYKVLKKNGVKYVVSLHDYWFICPRIKMVRSGCVRCPKACHPDCYKCFSLFEGNYFLMRCFKKLFQNKNIENFPIKSRKTYKNWIKYNKELLENANALLPVSKKVEYIYRESGIIGNYHTLHIGNITADTFDYNYKYTRGKTINLVMLSSLNVLKGGELISDIMKRVSNPLIVLHFWGRASDKEIGYFDGLNFINHGTYKQVELANILKSMDLGIMTPIWEDNGPQVVMEMINNHLPVFGTKMGGIPDFVNFENGFLFDPFSKEGIGSAIDFLNNLNFDTIEKLKKNITPTETTKGHFEKLTQVYEGIFDEKR